MELGEYISITMETYVIEFYLYCRWKDLPPTYRLYFDDELVTERTYIWHNDTHVLQERVPVTTDSNKATIRIEQVGQHSGIFNVKHLKTDPPSLHINVDIV